MVEVRKLNIIKVIMSIDNDDILQKIENQAILLQKQIQKPNVFDAIKPIRETRKSFLFLIFQVPIYPLTKAVDLKIKLISLLLSK